MKIFALILVATLLIAATFFGYEQYEHYQLFEQITQLVKNASIHVNNSSNYETETDTNITFGELLKRLESDISEVDNQLIEVQKIATPKTKELTDPVIEYLKLAQEYLRTILQFNRKIVANNNAHNVVKVVVDDIVDITKTYLITHKPQLV
jgi:hypothetical protein